MLATSSAAPFMEAARERLRWLIARQSVLAANVAHADTPGFKPRDLAPAGAPGPVALTRTSAFHLGGRGAGGYAEVVASSDEVRADGNGVSVEEEAAKIAANGTDHAAAAALYARCLGFSRLALGRR